MVKLREQWVDEWGVGDGHPCNSNKRIGIRQFADCRLRHHALHCRVGIEHPSEGMLRDGAIGHHKLIDAGLSDNSNSHEIVPAYRTIWKLNIGDLNSPISRTQSGSNCSVPRAVVM